MKTKILQLLAYSLFAFSLMQVALADGPNIQAIKTVKAILDIQEEPLSAESIEGLFELYGEEWTKAKLVVTKNLIKEDGVEKTFVQRLDSRTLSVSQARLEILINAYALIVRNKKVLALNSEEQSIIADNAWNSRRLRSIKTFEEQEELDILSGLLETLLSVSEI